MLELPHVATLSFSTDPFDPDLIDPESANMNREVIRQMTLAPARWEMPATAERLLPPAAGAVPVAASGRPARVASIPGPAGQVSVRIIEPDNTPRGVYLHFHPGGFCVGAAANHDAMLAETANSADVVTISVDYRLAPEDPYPAGPADCEAAAMWVLQYGVEEFGTRELVIGGESAGSTLAAVTALRLRDRHGFTDIAGLNLSQGTYDLRLTPSTRAYGDTRLILNTPTAASLLGRYVQSADPAHPDVSPLFADLSGLPSALFTVGTLDPLLDDNLFMYTRWMAARSQARIDIHPGAMHGFNLFPTALGQRACARINDFISQSLNDAAQADT